VELTKRQRNEIFEALQAKGVNPADCRLSTSRDSATIVHEPSTSKFIFFTTDEAGQFDCGGYVIDGPGQNDIGLTTKNWTNMLGQLRYWAEEVKYNAENPDLWAELRLLPKVLTAAQEADASNEPFTADEQAEIANRLDEVKQLVRQQFELTDDQLAAIDVKMDDLKEASKRLGRKTWVYTFYGAVMSTFMTDEIPPHVIQTIVTTVLHGIGHLFGIGGAPPIIGP
jgi:hypothetical protein